MNPLTVPKAFLGKGSVIPFEILPDDNAVIDRFSDDLLAEYLAAKHTGRDKVVFILPVGPVGQFDILADRCNSDGISWQAVERLNC